MSEGSVIGETLNTGTDSTGNVRASLPDSYKISKGGTSGGHGPEFASPSTGRKFKVMSKKAKVVEVNEENMYALINEIYDLQKRSYFDKRLLKVRKSTTNPANSKERLLKVNHTDRVMKQSNEQLEELNEQVILKQMDNKKTYYNSVMSQIKPKFSKFLRRNRDGQLDEEGKSIRMDDLSSIDFSDGI